MFSVNEVQALWLLINGAATVLTFFGLVDALRDRRNISRSNGTARTLVAGGSVRREVLRLMVQALLLSLVIPHLFDDAPTPLTLPVLALLGVAALLLLNTLLDARERHRLAGILDAEILAERLRQ